ncbi:MAG: InlB B-repeat-containing protein, partial [Clostridia bacterium]|nr:InlB B-repeat-containing protein [Clostridia bacterium]
MPENPNKTGYTFAGWDYDFNNEIVDNVTTTAKWSANKYALTFDVAGGQSVATQEVIYDQSYTLPTTSREGYTFVGWFNGESQVNDGVWTTDGHVTLVARWSKNEYTITYNLNGGENAIENPTSYSIDSPTITLTNPTKRGYNFIGWTEGSNIPTGSIGNKTFTANWQADLNGVSFKNATHVYDGNEKELVISGNLPSGVSVSYSSNKLVNVGEIKVTATFSVDESATLPFDSLSATLTITKAEAIIDFSQAVTEFTYSGEEHSVSGVVGSGEVSYQNNVFTNAGEYDVKIFVAESSNYLSGEFTIKAVVNKANITGITFEDAEFMYDVTYKSIFINGTLPENVEVVYENNNQLTVGEYEVIARFIVNNPNYNEKEAMKATLYIRANVNQVYFVYDENNILTKEVLFGSDLLEIPEAPQKDGYNSKWDTSDFTNVRKDLYVYPIFEIITYNITYVLNGATNNVNNPTSYTIETETITLKDAVVKDGKFGGWYTSKIFAGSAIKVIEKGSTGDLTLYANVISYAIESAEGFEIVGNTITCTVSNSIDRISLKDVITVSSGCTWELYKEYTIETLLKAKNMMLEIGDNYAYIMVWSPDGEDFNQYEVHVYRLHTYTYTYKVGDEVYATETHEENSMVTPPSNPIVEHYNFTNWDRDGKAVVFPEICKCDTTLEAVFTPVEYDIIYALDEGVMNNENNPKSYNIENWEVVISSLLPASKDHYDFAEWIISVEDYERLENGTFGAISIRPTFTPTVYSISYELNGGTYLEGVSYPTEYTIESNDIILVEPFKTYYSFNAFYAESDFQNEVDIIATGSYGNKTFYAKWTPIEYAITIDLSGGVAGTEYPTHYNVENAEVELAVIDNNPPTKEHYEFSGWSYIEIENPTNETVLNLNLVAVWTPVVYTLSYDLDEGALYQENPATYTIESETFTLVTPEKYGYTFVGWLLEGEEEPVETVTIELGSYGNRKYIAIWELNYYSITYVFGDATSVSKATHFNFDYYTIYDEFTFNAPERVGYTF